MSDEQQSVRGKNEKTRLCPSCRMSISILATKCRFCGETVGRPKEETRSLSIQDLGGETIVHYAPSSNVMEALESFRMEEVVPAEPPEPKKKTLFGRKASGAEAESPKPGMALPELDERSKALASLVTPVRPALSKTPAKPTWMRKIAVLGGFVAAVVILYFGSVQVGAIIRGWKTPEPTGPRIVNHAPAMMERGAPPSDIHREAFTSYQKEGTQENLKVLSQARQLVIDEVRGLLDSPSISVSTLVQASNKAKEALMLDPSEDIRALKEEVDQENTLYGLSVVSTNAGPKANPRTAEIQLFDKTRVTVKPNDVILDRFRVTAITDKFVRLSDLKHLTASGIPRSVQVSSEGIPR